ncbi:MAG: hypothetical protein ABIH92_00985 [Nanoarchaeota archaeon]
MGKKWWLLILIVVIIAGFVMVKNFTGRTVIDSGDGGIVVFPGDPSGGDTTDDSDDQTDGEQSDPVLDPSADCWQCPEDGIIINLAELGITWDELTDEFVDNETNCTNKSELVQVDCPVECNDEVDNDEDGLIDYPSDLGCISEADDSEENCGNGICEEIEDEMSCSADCEVAESPSGDDYSDESDGGDSGDESGDSGGEDDGSEDEVGAYSDEGFYYVCSIENLCVQRAIPDGGNPLYYPDECSTDSQCEGGESEEPPGLNPPEDYSNVLRILLRAMFGFE